MQYYFRGALVSQNDSAYYNMNSRDHLGNKNTSILITIKTICNMRLLTLLGTAASVLATVSAIVAFADFAIDENIPLLGPFKRCQTCGSMGSHKREGRRDEYPAWREYGRYM
ncbi:hypothetical protein BGZ93_007708 [Podila epicladia]|nr:hypothetical protein BGZ93_007708 [Podila epicladia]